jgi:hypothetical protein
MAYTIVLPDREWAETFTQRLAAKVEERGRFTIAEIEPPTIEVLGARARAWRGPASWCASVRSASLGRPYCGQHPGRCLLVVQDGGARAPVGLVAPAAAGR